jgi:hypothetical protein
MHGILPLKAILASIHIPTIDQCPICDNHCEDIRHMVFECGWAASLWKELGLEDVIIAAKRDDRSGSVMLEILLRKDRETMPGYSSIQRQELIAH